MRLARVVVCFGLALHGAVEAPGIHAQDTPQFYAHVGAGVGASLLNSGDITDIITDYGIGIAGSYSILGRVGLKNIVQAEYRRGTEGGHEFLLSGLVSGGSQPFGIVDELEMDYDFSQWTGKLNPFFQTERRFNVFLVGGQSKADFVNPDGEGFEGTGTIVGVELMAINRQVSGSVALLRHGMTFTSISPELYGRTLDSADELGGSNWIAEFTFAFGLGM